MLNRSTGGFNKMKKQSRSIARKSATPRASVKKAPAKTSRKKAIVGRRKARHASASATPVRTVARKASRSVAGTLKKLMAR
jgi:hypothetical protein